LVAFVRTVAPFDDLDDERLDRLVTNAVIEQYDGGDVIVDAFDTDIDELFIVWNGRVGIWSHPDRLGDLPDETAGPGGIFGYVAALTGSTAGLHAVAAGEVVVIRLPADLASPAFASRRGARFLAQEVGSTSRRLVGIPAYTLVDDLISRPPLLVPAEATLAEAARRMVEADLGYAAVRLGTQAYGLLTDADLRHAVAAGTATTTTVGDLMRADPALVPLGASATEALIRILDAGAEFVLVTDPGGDLRGVVAPIDFVVSSTTVGAAVHEQLRRASSVEELQLRYREVPALIAELLGRGLASRRVISVYSALVDTLVRRAVDLVLAGHPDLDPAAFTWLSLGSNGRREAVLGSDMDAAVAFADDLSADGAQAYRAVLAEVIGTLERAGLTHDSHGVSPANATFARTRREWESAARGWISAPMQDDAILMTCLLVDARPIHGDLGLPTVARVFNDLRLYPVAMRALHAISVDRFDPTRGRRRRQSLDLKAQALLPIANIARWAALSVGSTALSTTDRLHEAAGSRTLSSADAESLADIFEVVQRIRLRHQLREVAAGRQPTDSIELQQISTIEISVLNEAAREINAIRRRMANVARYALEA
jgi:CBS domain-containing protein